jgi:2-amino-4-hydroxy-6-hydroxymethyldihydropteridine diphosphokinase
LTAVRRIEADLGRMREISKGPRTIDVDILLLGSTVIAEKDLQIPHPAMHVRRFVLEPLVEIAPEIRHPVLARTARELLQDSSSEGGTVRRLATK